MPTGSTLRAMNIRVSAVVVVNLVTALAGADPSITSTFSSMFQMGSSLNTTARATQMTWGPDNRVYVSSDNNGVQSYAYNKSTGTLSDSRQAVSGINGLGIAFHGGDMYLSSLNGSIYKLTDSNHNGIFGETNETKVAIVTGIPIGDHSVDNIQIKGNTLYVGIGLRTINGRRGEWTSGSHDDYGGKGFWSGGIGKTWGDSAYGGTISWIQDLTKVADTTGSANVYGNTTVTDALIHDASPFSNAVNKLTIHSAGTRNPFGLALDKNGDLYFSANFNRTDTNGDGTSGFGLHGDVFNGDFSKNVHDQFFKASQGGDYRYANDVWRGNTPFLNPNATGYHQVKSLTFDNLDNKGPYTLTDPANPDGLGPSSSSDGFSFFYSSNLKQLSGDAFLPHNIRKSKSGRHSFAYVCRLGGN